MNDHTSGVSQYFDKAAARFDSIYSEAKPWHQRLVDRAFRATVNQRFEFIVDDLSSLEGKTVLDIGTGSGRYAVELAARGASVTGIDFSSEMLALAEELALKRGVNSRCRWLKGDFLELKNLESRYDVCLAIGLFDYVNDPTAILSRMASVTRDVLYASFPKRWTVRTLPRKVRLQILNGCYVRFYDGREMRDLAQPFVHKAFTTDIISVNRDFILRARNQ